MALALHAESLEEICGDLRPVQRKGALSVFALTLGLSGLSFTSAITAVAKDSAVPTAESCDPATDSTPNSAEKLLQGIELFEKTGTAKTKSLRLNQGFCRLETCPDESLEGEQPLIEKQSAPLLIKPSLVKQEFKLSEDSPLKDALMVISKQIEKQEKEETAQEPQPIMRARLLSEDSKLVQVNPETKEVSEIELPEELSQQLREAGANFDSSGRYLELKSAPTELIDLLRDSRVFNSSAIQHDPESSTLRIDLDPSFEAATSTPTPKRSPASPPAVFTQNRIEWKSQLDPVTPELCEVIEKRTPSFGSETVVECIRRGWITRREGVQRTYQNYYAPPLQGLLWNAFQFFSGLNGSGLTAQSFAEDAEPTSTRTGFKKGPTNSHLNNSLANSTTAESVSKVYSLPSIGAGQMKQNSKDLKLTDSSSGGVDPLKSMADALTALGIIHEKNAKDSKEEPMEDSELNPQQNAIEPSAEGTAKASSLNQAQAARDDDINSVKYLNFFETSTEVEIEPQGDSFEVIDGYLVPKVSSPAQSLQETSENAPSNPSSDSNSFDWQIPPFVLPERRRKALQQNLDKTPRD